MSGDKIMYLSKKLVIDKLNSLTECKIATDILVPLLKKKGLKGVKFTGGSSEEGIDIEYYEVSLADNEKLYTGIQLKKGNITYSSRGSNGTVNAIKNQAEAAFAKDIYEINSGGVHHLFRFIVATTGEINENARKMINKAKTRGDQYNISYWDADKLVDDIRRNFFDEFIDYFELKNKRYDLLNPFFNCVNFKELFEKAIIEVYKISGTDYNQVILNTALDTHSFGLAVVACIIKKPKQIYRVVSVEGIITRSYGLGKTINISDVSNETKYMCAVSETRSELVVPIRNEGNVVGVINIESEECDYFNNEMIDKIEYLSECFGFVLRKLGFCFQNYKELPYIAIDFDLFRNNA